MYQCTDRDETENQSPTKQTRRADHARAAIINDHATKRVDQHPILPAATATIPSEEAPEVDDPLWPEACDCVADVAAADPDSTVIEAERLGFVVEKPEMEIEAGSEFDPDSEPEVGEGEAAPAESVVVDETPRDWPIAMVAVVVVSEPDWVPVPAPAVAIAPAFPVAADVGALLEAAPPPARAPPPPVLECGGDDWTVGVGALLTGSGSAPEGAEADVTGTGTAGLDSAVDGLGGDGTVGAGGGGAGEGGGAVKVGFTSRQSRS